MAVVLKAPVPLSMQLHGETVRCKGTNYLCLDISRGNRSRGFRSIVAASPPTEDPVVAADPLTKEDLVNYLASGCKPKQKWRIGTEHEKFGFEIDTLRPMKYEQIAELLNGIAERFDWDKVMEGDYIIGLKQVNFFYALCSSYVIFYILSFSLY